jgi:hypothetical protein
MFVGYSEKAKNFCTAARILSHSRFWHSRQQSHNPLHPAVAAAFKLDDPYDWQQLLLEWPYVSKTDVTRLAYTRDERGGEDDRQVLTSLGKYLKRHWPDMADHTIRDFVAKYATASEFRIERTTAAIVNAVQNGPASCMQFDEDDEGNRDQLDTLGHHPYEAYAPCYGWHVATRRLGHQIVGRALLMQRDNDETAGKYFVRTYKHKDGETYSQPDDELIQWLKSQGYEHRSSWQGERLMYIASGKRHADSEFIAPYLDGGAQCVDIDTAHISEGKYKRFLKICSDGAWSCSNTCGHATEQDTCQCEDCGSRVSEDDRRDVGMHHDRTVGECCIGDYTMVTGRRGNEYYVPNDQAVNVDDEYYDRDYLGDNSIVELHDGDYCSMDNAVCVNDEWYHCDDETIVCVNDEWYHCDDETIVCDHAGDYQLRDDCVELHDSEWALRDEAWECAGSGNWYLEEDNDPVFIDGETYHEDYVPETDDETPAPAPVTTKESA